MLQLLGMKLIIVAGGTGTRLWPLSRKALPKQFIPMFNGKSTLQLVFARVAPVYGIENILVSTNEAYRKYIIEQLPDLPPRNIIEEPEKRDLGPAVGLNLMHLKKRGYSGPVALLWADHLMDNVPEFIKSLKTAEKICVDDPKKVVLISEQPRFPNNNLGWINFGKQNPGGSYGFVGFKYKPEFATCEKMFASGEWDWNPGYMVYDVDHALGLFKAFAPDVHDGLTKIYEAIGTEHEARVTADVYPTIPKIHHDHVIAEKLSGDDAVVVRSNMGWSDPGTLYALKEALTKIEADNLVTGMTKTIDTTDSLVMNEEPGKLVATVGLSGMVVVNTADVLVIVPKTEILKLSELVNQLAEDPETEKFT
jgi:mannose-1-phosphate guanylyltransferase